MNHSASQPTADYNPLSAEAREDPELYWRELRITEPVHHFVIPDVQDGGTNVNPFAAEPTTEFWTLLRHADVEQALMSPKVFSSCQGPGPDRMSPDLDGGVLIFADGDVHRRQRRLATKAFTPKAVDLLAPQIQQKVDELIDKHAGQGRMEVMKDFGIPLAISTILQIMGVSVSKADDFHDWGSAIDNTFGGDPAAIQAGGEALAELFAYVQTLIDAVRAGNSAQDEQLDHGVLAALVRAEHEGSTLSDNEICQIVMQLIVAGYETTSTALLNGVHALCTHPEQRRRFEAADSAGVAAAVEEILRYAGPQAGLFRTTTEPVEIRGCPLPRDAKVRVAYASANRDEETFTAANEFRIDRARNELRRHVAFGKGPHSCIGSPLARAELCAALETLFRRLPTLQLDPDREPRRNNTKLTITGLQELWIRWAPDSVRAPAS